jgi:putative endonuclease
MAYFVYMLRTAANTLYTGQTNNPEKRLKEHMGRSGRGAKYLRRFPACRMVHIEEFATRSEAMKREYFLKQLTKAQKEALIKNGNHDGRSG